MGEEGEEEEEEEKDDEILFCQTNKHKPNKILRRRGLLA